MSREGEDLSERLADLAAKWVADPTKTIAFKEAASAVLNAQKQSHQHDRDMAADRDKHQRAIENDKRDHSFKMTAGITGGVVLLTTILYTV